MQCGTCGASLERPGDYCLVCESGNADAVVVDATRDRVEVTILDDGEALGTAVVTTVPEDGEDEIAELRNFAGRVADQVHRKRPGEVYAAGDRAVIRELRGQLHYDLYRVAGDDPVAAALGEDTDPLETDHRPPAEKLGGTHSSVVGGREGQKALRVVAGHPHVKKVVPGPIDAGGIGSQKGVRAKASRADDNGNLRLLVRTGSSVQENRVITTARDRETGERVREDVAQRLAEADLQ